MKVWLPLALFLLVSAAIPAATLATQNGKLLILTTSGTFTLGSSVLGGSDVLGP